MQASLVAARRRPFATSIIKQQLMALTGLLLCGFLVIHLIGNLLLFRGADVFNQYAHLMLNNPVIALMEWVLGGLFLMHAVVGTLLIVDNRRARPVPYAVRATMARGANLSFISMAVTGPLILLFLLIHVADFRFGTVYLVDHGGVEVRDLYRTVVEAFADPLFVGFYVLAMVTVALHVLHGFWSAFQSFGVNHPRYNRVITLCSSLFALVMLVTFTVIVLFFFITSDPST